MKALLGGALTAIMLMLILLIGSGALDEIMGLMR